MDVITFIHDYRWDDVPEEVKAQAHRCLLDTIGAAAGGHQTNLSRIIGDYAVGVYSGEGSALWFDGRPVSSPGAGLANGMTIDALDIHDGFNMVKGHAGAALVPALLASLSLVSEEIISGKDLLTALVIGYEVALRAGLALHATACDYHTSGAWNALGCAAITSRFMRLNEGQTNHALGIAEYHGPRSQMMRCIDFPTMVKDGSGWGAMTGISAAMLAGAGFTGAPALTVSAPEVGSIWADLGSRWLIMDQYFKPYAVCRWAQPAVVGSLSLRQQYGIQPETIHRIRVNTFDEAVRLAVRRPTTTEEAQYSLPFPVATALVHQRLGPVELGRDGLDDPMVLALAEKVELAEDPHFSAQFPARRLAQVLIETKDGAQFDTGAVEATWGADDPPSDEDLKLKFRWLAGGTLSNQRVTALEQLIWKIAELSDVTPLLIELASPPQEAAL
jgi:2-methylcitrate dehydratase PrpD